ncbi:MAG: SIMPL domain-containing protein [Firmicutes bacterium]|nr:SIMPL domain-containing protein [Bacillota bacterium]
MQSQQIVFIAIAVLALVSVAFADVGLAQEIRQIYVRGQGSIGVDPDLAHITLGVVTQALEAEEAQTKNAINMRNILAALGEMGIKGEDIETSYFNVYPVYRYDQENGEQLTGYRVSNTISIKLKDLPKVGEVIDVAIKAGATNVNAVRFALTDEEPWLEKALALAVENGRRRAEVMAKAAGERLGPVMVIRDPSTQFEPYFGKGEMLLSATADRGMPTPIQPGKLQINAAVEMVFALE